MKENNGSEELALIPNENDNHKKGLEDEAKRYLDLELVVSELTEDKDLSYCSMYYDQTLKSYISEGDVIELNKLGSPFMPVIAAKAKKIENNGIIIAKQLADNLKIKKGDKIKFRKLEKVPIINLIECSLKDDTSMNETESQEFLKFLKAKLAYNYVKRHYEFEFNKKKFCVEIKDHNKNYGQITPYTNLLLNLDSTSDNIEKRKSIIGLEDAYESIREIMEWRSLYKTEFEKLNVEVPKGILLHGQPGTGKTHLVRELAKAFSWAFYKISGPEIMSKFIGNSEKYLRQVFETAKKNQPAIIFFDEIDAIGQARSSSSEVEARIVSQLLTCMDGLVSRGDVLVIAATNYPNKLDPALRRPDRLDREVKIKVPNIRDRTRLLAYFIKDKNLLAPDCDLKNIAKKTGGYVQADLKFLVNEAKLNVIRRKRSASSLKELENFEEKLTKEDFQTIMNDITPSSLRDQNILKPDTKFSEVIGYEEVKKTLLNEVYYPLKYPQLFRSLNVKSIKGLLFEGPPGTGKTTLAKALASELDYNFMVVNGPELINKFVGGTEQNVRDLFSKAREAEPCVIFFDEIDSLFSQTNSDIPSHSYQNSKLGQFLTEIDGIKKKDNILLIGTTNKVDLLDPAMTRSGRFEMTLTLGYPTLQELRKLYEYYFSSVTETRNFDSLLSTSLMNKLTGADIASLKREVIIDHIKKMSKEDLLRKELLCKLKYPVKLNVSITDLKRTLDRFIKKKQEYYKNLKKI